MSPIRLGFVGLSNEGWASLALAPPLLQPALNDKYTLTAKLLLQRAPKYSELTGHEVKPYHGDTAQIAADPNVDLVAVAVKASAHKNAALPVIEAGKDLFIEWPAGKNLEETSQIAEAALRKGVRTIVGLQGRLSPTVQKVKELVASGEIGKVLSTSIVAMIPREVFLWGPWINERNSYTVDATMGATVLDVVVGHTLDSLTFALGDVKSVSATTALHYKSATLFDGAQKPTGKTITATADDHIAFTGTLDSGAILSAIWRGGLSSTPGRKQFVWEIDGEDGSIRVENDGISGAIIQVVDPKLYLKGELVSLESDGFPNNSARAWNEFAKGKNGQYATIDDAVRVHSVLDAVAKSSKEGRRIDLK